MSVACITGSSSGIGKELAKILSSKGYDLVLIARNTSALEELSHELISKCTIIKCDLSVEAECFKLANKLKSYKPSILINNAGFGDLSPFIQCDITKAIAMIKVNITAVQILTHELLPVLSEQSDSYIMNIASSAGLMYGGPYMSTYYATKSYVCSLTMALQYELQAAHSPVHVCMVCPGPVDTAFNRAANVSSSLKGISASYCAAYAIKCMFKKKKIIIPTFKMKLAIWGIRFLPRGFVTKLTALQQKKKTHTV